MKNINRENFLDGIKDKYPSAFDHFNKWLGLYKNEVEWIKLFNHGSPRYARMGWHNPDFHDLPFEMQAGIIARYLSEVQGEKEKYENVALPLCMARIEKVFDGLNKNIEINKKLKLQV